MARNWKRIVPSNTREAIRLCKDFAKEVHNLSVEPIADIMGVSSDSLYGWLGNGKLPANLIPAYENACGCHFLSEHLIHAQGKLAISISIGRNISDKDFLQLHNSFSSAVAILTDFHKGKASAEESIGALTHHMQIAGWHRNNIEKQDSPELDF